MNPIHFIGIEGTGMSAAAHILLESNIQISGSDLHPGEKSRQFIQHGALIQQGHRAENIPANTELVVISAAIQEQNPELQEARRRNLPVIKYAQFLGKLMENKQGITVAGTHGKSTVSGMLASLLYQAELDPSFIVGAILKEFHTNSRKGQSNYFIAEACEYDHSFLNLHPYIGIITNIEPDHLDYYKTFANIIQAFHDYATLIPKQGKLIIEAKAKTYLPNNYPCSIETYSLYTKADWQVKNIQQLENHNQFTVFYKEREIGTFRIQLLGLHNIENTLPVIATGHSLNIPIATMQRAIFNYQGIERRFDILSEKPITIIDDYAHHPTEIQATLQAWQELGSFHKKYCIFQPHQASRTALFLKELATSFSHVDEIIISDIFFARDSAQDKEKIHAKTLVEEIRKNGQNAHYIGSMDAIIQYLQDNLVENDSILTMGAGTICYVAQSIATIEENKKACLKLKIG